jgi:hypothetical protein
VSADRDRDLVARLSEAARADAAREADAGPGVEAWHRLQQARAHPPGARAWRTPAAVAAALALASGLTFGWLARRPRPLTYAVSGGQVETNGYVARPGESPTELRFSDGTRVALARAARMSVAATGALGARLRVEDGQAHFEVTHRPGADWSVEAGPYRVLVTGTVFDVRWAGGDEATVALRVGSVRVTGPRLAAPVTLAPGQRFVARLSTGAVRLETGALDDGDAAAPPPRPEEPRPAVAPAAEAERPAPATARAARPARAPTPPRPDEPAWTPLDWDRRVASGDSAGVLADARVHGLDDVVAGVDARALTALADAARYAGQPALSARALTELRRRFPASVQAPGAAFELGRLADNAGDARGARAFYRRYAEEAPRGAYAAEACGREMLDTERLDGRAAAAPAARAYLDRFPDGTYLLQARAILGLP